MHDALVFITGLLFGWLMFLAVGEIFIELHDRRHEGKCQKKHIPTKEQGSGTGGGE